MAELTSAQWLRKLANEWDDYARIGADADKPEGMRVVALSDTLMRHLAARFRLIANEIEIPPGYITDETVLFTREATQ